MDLSEPRKLNERVTRAKGRTCHIDEENVPKGQVDFCGVYLSVTLNVYTFGMGFSFSES